VSSAEVISFRERHGSWAAEWERFSARGALADQVRFEREWCALRSYAGDRGVRLYGDVAIYVAPGSADHRAHPWMFRSGLVAGAPPDAFTDDGQLWGNPVYDWPALQRRRYRWWVERLRRTLSLFDLARIDHFRGFVSYWAVPAGARTARSGTWQRGPGRAVFDAVSESLGDVALVAEDLGVITPAVTRLRESLGFPGMVVLQFGFDPRAPGSVHRFENHVEDRVVYTGTHDHDTARGWYSSLSVDERSFVDASFERYAVVERQPWWSLIRLALRSPARVAMVQAQDVLGLGSEARMNNPGRTGGNWRWRMERGALTPALARRLRVATTEAGRLASRGGGGS
jgi:4-alpha-glucanotransferase